MAMAWKKHNILGFGSYGTVYLAAPVGVSLTSPASTLAAVKSVEVDFSLTLEKEARFLKELRGNPYIVQCFGEDISEENDQNFYNLLMEYAPGGDLDMLIQENGGTIPESQVACYTYMLLRGISAMHKYQIVHCDLKPRNILVFPPDRDGLHLNRLKIADFGLAKKKWEVTEPILKFGGLFRNRGTLDYASPESMCNGIHEKSTDIWALGCIVHEMITGKTIWSYKYSQDLLRLILFEEEPKIPENISEDGKNFLRKCLEKEACGRWTAEELLDHPFIVNNLNLLCMNESHDQEASSQTSNPFGKWISKFNLFGDSTCIDQPQGNPSCSSYRDILSAGENKTEESQHPLAYLLPEDLY